MRTRLLLAFCLVGVLPPVFLFFGIQYTTQQHSAQLARDSLAQISLVQQRRINVELERMAEHLALVASRTQMRLSLRDYVTSGEPVHIGLINRILGDALAAQHNIIGIWLYDADGALVTRTIDAQRMPSSVLNPPEPDGNRPMQMHWDGHSTPHLWLQGPLNLDGRRIGNIRLLMTLDEIRSVLQDFPHEQQGGKTFLLLSDRNGRIRALDAHLQPANSRAGELTTDIDGPVSAPTPVDDGPAETGRPQWIDDNLVWARPLNHAVGHVMISLSMETFAAELRQQTDVLLYLIGFAATLSIGMALLLARAMARPLEVLSRATRALQQGRDDVVIREPFWGEFAELVASFNYAADMISRRTTSLNKEVEARRASQKELADMANTDALTGLVNRRHFMEVLERRLHQPGAAGRSDALLYLDLDGFKPVNDRLGHEAGDILLRVVAQRLRHLVRDQDQVARIGGDEFTLLLVDEGGEPVEAEAIARRAKEQISLPINVKDQRVHVGCSIGITRLVAGSDAQSMLNRADEAMYRVKARRHRGTGIKH